jgi:DegV family protein with EDD domain
MTLEKIIDSETAIMIDSTTPLTDEMRDYTFFMDDPHNNSHLGDRKPMIFKIPLYLIYHDSKGDPHAFRENSVSDIDEFKKEMGISKFASSQPPPADFLKLYDTIRGFGYSKAIGLFLSDKLTGTGHDARGAAKDYKGLKSEFIDTNAGSGEITLALDRMIEHSHQGFERMIDAGKRAVEKTRIYFSVESLENLRNTGRLSEAGLLLASVLKIKPIITVGKKEDGESREGRMFVKEKIAGSSIERTLPKLADYARKSIEKYNVSRGMAYVVDINFRDMADSLYSQLQEIPIFKGNLRIVRERSNIMYSLVGPAVAVATMPADY